MHQLQLDAGIISGSFDEQLDLGLVGTTSGSIWYISWKAERPKICLMTTMAQSIMELVSVDASHIAISTEDGFIRTFCLDNHSETSRIIVDVEVSILYLVVTLTDHF